MNSKSAMKRSLSLLPVILALGWPTMLEQLMQTTVQYMDTAMVGSLGTEATAAVGSTSTVNWLIGSTISALGVGFLSYISQAIGAHEPERAKRASAQAVFVTVIVGIVATFITLSLSSVVPAMMQVDPAIRPLAARYFFILYIPMLPRTASILFGTILRSAGDTKTPMRAGILVNIINVSLNFLLIYPSRRISGFGLSVPMLGAGLGVIGAAIASAFAFFAGGVLLTVRLWQHETVSPKKQRFLPDSSILFPCLKVAIPNMLQRFCTSLGYVVFASMINSLGELSTAAHTIANTVESAFYIPGFGMMTASATLTGNCIGSRDEQRRRDMARMIVVLEFSMMLVSGGLLFTFAPFMTSLFTKDVLVIALSTKVLRMVALSEPFYGIMIVIEGMLQGAGETRRPFLYNLAGMWVIRIFGTFLLVTVLQHSLIAAWGCMIAGNMTLMFLYTICYFRGKWNPLNKPAAN